ncbi:MAG TPA: hypothetical protein VNK24_00795 [Elusimicrobiota bacterium]|nr:hypothetical protein [Elusimicrobiota bacterium]
MGLAAGVPNFPSPLVWNVPNQRIPDVRGAVRELEPKSHGRAQSFAAAARAKAARRLNPARNPYKTLPLGWMEPDLPFAFSVPVKRGAWRYPADGTAALVFIITSGAKARLPPDYPAAAQHCAYDDDAGGWVDCDHKPGVPYYDGTLHLEGPGLDPACDVDIARPPFGCPKP